MRAKGDSQPAEGERALSRAVEELAKETEGVKRLLITLLLKLGATSDEIGVTLDVAPSVIRTMIPSRKIKKLDFDRRGDEA